MEQKIFNEKTDTGIGESINLLAYNYIPDAASSRRSLVFHFALNDTPASGTAVVNIYGNGEQTNMLLDKITISSTGFLTIKSDQLRVGSGWGVTDIVGLILNSSPYNSVTAEIVSNTLVNGSAAAVGISLTAVFQ